MAVRTKKDFADVLGDMAKQAGFIDGVTLANKCGLNPSTVRTWLRGESEPRFLQLASLAKVIQAPLDKLAYSDETELQEAVGDEVWTSFSESQQAALLKCARILSKLNRRLFPAYDPVTMFMASIQATSDMCDSFIGRLPPGSVPDRTKHANNKRKK